MKGIPTEIFRGIFRVNSGRSFVKTHEKIPVVILEKYYKKNLEGIPGRFLVEVNEEFLERSSTVFSIVLHQSLVKYFEDSMKNTFKNFIYIELIEDSL